MKKTLSMLLALAMVFSLSACGTSGTPTGSSTSGNPNSPGSSGGADSLDPITLSIGHTGAEDSWNQAMCLAVKDKLDELSGGKITVTVYPNGQLGSDSEMVISVVNGDLSMQCTNTSSVVNTVPDCGVADIPFLFSSVEDVRAALSDETFNSMLGESFHAADLHLLMAADQGFRCITSSRNITCFEDLAGLQIRVMDNANHIAFFTDATLAPTPLSFSELYLALQQGLLQAQENPYRTTAASKFYEVQKYLTMANRIYHTMTFLMSDTAWNNLTEAQQNILLDAVNESKLAHKDYMTTYNEDAIKDMVDNHGLVVSELADGEFEKMREMSQSVYELVRGYDEDMYDKLIAAAEEANAAFPAE